VKPVEAFFIEIDASWRLVAEQKVRLQILGASALLLQLDYARGTKDSDILQTMSVTPEIKEHLLKIAGPGTELASRHCDRKLAGIRKLRSTSDSHTSTSKRWTSWTSSSAS
jgi:hypothetical protein